MRAKKNQEPGIRPLTQEEVTEQIQSFIAPLTGRGFDSACPSYRIRINIQGRIPIRVIRPTTAIVLIHTCCLDFYVSAFFSAKRDYITVMHSRTAMAILESLKVKIFRQRNLQRLFSSQA